MNEEHDRRAGFDRWLLAQSLTGAGILVNSALYIAMVFIAAILAQAPIARDFAIATAGACYFAYVAQLHGKGAETPQAVLGVLSAALGVAAGFALIFGV